MNYYPFHIGDFRSGTINMTRQTRWIYRDLLDIYYDTEKPLPLDLEALCDMAGATTEEEQQIVKRLLRFKFVRTDEGYRHLICDQVIVEYHTKAETAKSNGKLGGRPKKASANPEKPSGFPVGSEQVQLANPEQTGSEANQEPITNNQEPEGKQTPAPASPLPRRAKTRAADEFAEEFEVIWSAYPRKPGMSRADTLKAFSARVNEGADVDAMLAGVRAYAGYVHATRTEPKYIKAPETFFGPGKHWESDWTPPANAAQAPQARQAPVNEKFNFGHLDRSGDARAMEETIRRHGITVSEDEEIEL